MSEAFTEESVKKAFSGYVQKAKNILNDDKKIGELLGNLESKLQSVPVVGTGLADIVILAELVRAYVKKEYTDIRATSVAVATAAVLYFVTPIDLVPDFIPVLGFADDIAVIALAIGLIHSELMEFKNWQKNRSLEEFEQMAEDAVDIEYSTEEEQHV